MSFTGETNPVFNNNKLVPEQNRDIEKTHGKSESSWQGRKATHLKQKIDELAFRIEHVWVDAGRGTTKSVTPADYSNFLQEDLLFDSLGTFLVENRSDFSTKEKITDFLTEFAVAVKSQDKDTIIRVAKQLIDDNNPATFAFLYLCKDTAAFNTIVKKLLPRDAAFEFICHYAIHDEARNAIITLLKYRKETLPVFLYTTYYGTFTERELLSIGREIGELDLFKRFIEATKGDIDPHLITHFFNFPTKRNSDEISKALSYKLPITREMLCACITTRNFPGIERLLESCEKDFIVDAKEDIFKVLMLYRDPQLGALIIKHAPYLIDSISRENLDEAANDGNDWFFEWAISNGRTITAQEAEEMLPFAVAAGNLSLVKLLFNTTSDDGIHAMYTYPEDLEMDKETDLKELDDIVLHFAFFSPLEEVYALAGKYPHWADTLEKTITLLPLLVRFPNIEFTHDVGYHEKTLKEYEEGSKLYAKENREFIDKLLTQLEVPVLAMPEGSAKNILSRNKLLEMIMENRFGRLPLTISESTRDRYKDLRKRDAFIDEYIQTPLFWILDKYALAHMPVIFDAYPTRYSWCLKHLTELCYNSETKEWDAPSNTSMHIKEYTDIDSHYLNEIAYTYKYASEDGSKLELPMTTLIPHEIISAPHATLIRIDDHLETLHKEIVSYDLDLTVPENLKLFYEKVARGYWLFATLVESNRGTPHNAMIWLNLIYDLHKLPPPIPKIDHFFLDNTMIVTPIEKAIENWESYFEPTLDVALKNQYGDASHDILYRLLEKNGNLLKFCSPKVRDNKKYVDRAVETTPTAIQYASKRIHNNAKPLHNR